MHAKFQAEAANNKKNTGICNCMLSFVSVCLISVCRRQLFHRANETQTLWFI